MAPRVSSQPESLRNVLADEGDDCLPCKIVGSSAFIGLGAYSYFSGRHQLRRQEAAIVKSRSIFGMKVRRLGISGIAASLVGVGIYTLFN